MVLFDLRDPQDCAESSKIICWSSVWRIRSQSVVALLHLTVIKIKKLQVIKISKPFIYLFISNSSRNKMLILATLRINIIQCSFGSYPLKYSQFSNYDA